MNAAVYPVPDVRTGDQVMAALELDGRWERDRDLFPADLEAFLAAQPDLGTKWAPRFVRVVGAMPLTGTNKVDRQLLRRSAWAGMDPVYWRRDKGSAYERMTPADIEQLGREFEAHGRRTLVPDLSPRGLRT